MQDLSLHILDIAENSIKAGANLIEIEVNEVTKKNSLTIEIKDNGKGMSRELTANVKNPFTTTRTERKVGLGLSLLTQSAEAAGGNVKVKSKENKGTIVKAVFMYNHIDRKPLGNISETLMTLIANEKNVDLKYIHTKDNKKFIFDSREIKKEIGINSLKDSSILIELKELINSKLKEIS
jgi:anti-sigma regulatory factor (Ser/Thr protein kinase)